MNRNFRQMLEAQWDQGKFVCVGLDPVWDKIPNCVKRMREDKGSPRRGSSVHEDILYDFCTSIVDTTHHIACAYKLNAAAFEAMSVDGAYALEGIIRHINKVAPQVPVIYDAKRGDIKTSNVGYVTDAFGMIKADAITVNPYVGQDALQPFLDNGDKGIIVLCRTSNPGSDEFQDRLMEVTPEEIEELGLGNIAWKVSTTSDDGPGIFNLTHYFAKTYQVVAARVSRYWNMKANCLLVVGATHPKVLREVRPIVGDMPILIPGIGTQGGNIRETIQAAKSTRGRGMIISSSRNIIFASPDEDFANAARGETKKLHDLIQMGLCQPT